MLSLVAGAAEGSRGITCPHARDGIAGLRRCLSWENAKGYSFIRTRNVRAVKQIAKNGPADFGTRRTDRRARLPREGSGGFSRCFAYLPAKANTVEIVARYL
jgi:hypothetical protein